MVSDIHQISDDLRFVRSAVEGRGKPNPIEARYIYGYWALYVLIGYFLIDVDQRYAGPFFMVGGFLGAFVSWAVGKRIARRYGEVARTEDDRRAMLHWAGGMMLAVIGSGVLAIAVPELRGTIGSQVLLMLIGMVYFFWGVYADRNFLWLGPVLIAGAVAVRFIPHYPWTCVGAVIALGLVVPTLLTRRPPRSQEPAPQQQPQQA
jgi:hypothetical protein